jgi:hypothetical protein
VPRRAEKEVLNLKKLFDLKANGQKKNISMAYNAQ